MQVFVIINKVGIMINADVNANNWLKKKCDKGFFWNPSNCECECGKSCNVGEYLDYANCKCRIRLIDKLFEECSENIDEKELRSNEIDDYEKICSSCSVYIVWLGIFLILSISSVFMYFHWYLKKEQYWCY